MIPDNLEPLKAENFLQSALEYIEPLKGTHIHKSISRDYLEKTDISDAGYGRWLKQLLGYLSENYHLAGRRVLDFGCGTGELTVRMRTLGYEAYGVDLHERHLDLARILAAENGAPPETFVLNKPNGTSNPGLPFPDKSFDVITAFSVLEHLSDSTLAFVLPELRRVCRGVVYMLAPNRLKPGDDHTGLRFVCWLPRCLAVPYVGLRGNSSGYHISADGSWDVYNRTFRRVNTIVRRFGFRVEFPPDECMYPASQKPLTRLSKTFCISGKSLRISVPAPWNRLLNLGSPPQGFYPYLNMVWVPETGGGRR